MGLSEAAWGDLYQRSVAFRLYADHARGVSLKELARRSGQSEHWVQERVDAMRLCLEKQLRFIERALPRPEFRGCSEAVWAAQVWD